MTTDEGHGRAGREVRPRGRVAPRPGNPLLVLRGPLERTDIPGLCERAAFVAERQGTGHLVCDVRGLDPSAVTVEALARLQLKLRRRGGRLVIRRACGELRRLLVLTGLSDVLPCEDVSGLEPVGEAEQREQALGVEEERDPGDPVV